MEFRKQEFIDALRGGEYKQCTGSLHRDGRFCCIGVYGDIVGITRDDLNKLGHLIGPVDGGSEALIPLADIPNRRRLAEMNDEGKSFAEIADYIEANL